jgi:hypothetical protein
MPPRDTDEWGLPDGADDEAEGLEQCSKSKTSGGSPPQRELPYGGQALC